MSLVSKKFYNVKCDRCGMLLDEDMWYHRDSIEIEADWSGWITFKRMHYCPDCWELNDDDDIVIKPPIENADL